MPKEMVFNAVQWSGLWEDVPKLKGITQLQERPDLDFKRQYLWVKTVNGFEQLSPQGWVITTLAGEIRICTNPEFTSYEVQPRTRTLKLPNGTEDSFSSVEEYVTACNKARDQYLWVLDNSQLSSGQKSIQKSQYKLNELVTKHQQISRFNAFDLEKFDKDRKDFEETAMKIAKKEKEVSHAVTSWTNKLFEQYMSKDPAARDQGKESLLKILQHMKMSEEGYLEDWDNRHFHGSMEIYDLLASVYSQGKLNEIIWFIKN